MQLNDLMLYLNFIFYPSFTLKQIRNKNISFLYLIFFFEIKIIKINFKECRLIIAVLSTDIMFKIQIIMMIGLKLITYI